MSKQTSDLEPQITTLEQRVKDLISNCRAVNPHSRVVSLFPYEKNGSTQKSLRCVCCGQESPTWCGRWPKTERVKEWQQKHTKLHAGAGEK